METFAARLYERHPRFYMTFHTAFAAQQPQCGCRRSAAGFRPAQRRLAALAGEQTFC